jgi:uncharacterized membrane protein
MAQRYPIVDVFRGFAILLMIVYHFSWDLTAFGFAHFDIFGDPAWIWFAKSIAGLILLVMGVSQALAEERGFRLGPFFRRLALVSACAALVSVGTYFVDPRTFVYFGILHHIALASILLVGLLHLPTVLLAVLTPLTLATPWLLTLPQFTPNLLAWTGVTPHHPPAVDLVPLFPWFGIVLLGVVLGRTVPQTPLWATATAWTPSNILSRLCRLAGVHSLLIYMIHQPILFGGLWVIATL